MEDPMAQRILKSLEEHGKAFKKMRGHLTRLEESRLKKSTHVEIHDNEEDEEWDEKDKVEYERKKWAFFEKVTRKSNAPSSKILFILFFIFLNLRAQCP